MSFFNTLFSIGSNESNDGVNYSGVESPSHGGVNIDCTPMIDDVFDVNGDPYGCPSSLCGSDDDIFTSTDDDWMNSGDLFDEDW